MKRVLVKSILLELAPARNGRCRGPEIRTKMSMSPRTPNAFQSSLPLAEYVRDMLNDHILQRGAAFQEGGAALRALVRAGKAWVITYLSADSSRRARTQPSASMDGRKVRKDSPIRRIRDHNADVTLTLINAATVRNPRIHEGAAHRRP